LLFSPLNGDAKTVSEAAVKLNNPQKGHILPFRFDRQMKGLLNWLLPKIAGAHTSGFKFQIGSLCRLNDA